MTQSVEWIDAHGAARGDVAGQERDCAHEDSGGDEGEGVGRPYAVEVTGENTGNGERGSQAESDSNQREFRTFLHDEPEHIAALRAEGETNADFASAPGNEKRENAVDADETESERKRGKRDKQNRSGCGRGHGFINNGAHRPDLTSGDFGVETGDGSAKNILRLRFFKAGLHNNGHIGRDSATFESGFWRIRNIDRAVDPIGNILLQVIGTYVGDDAHDGAPLSVAVKTHARTNGASARPIAAGGGGGHDGDGRITGVVRGGEAAASQDGNTHEAKLIGRDDIHPKKRHDGAGGRGLNFDFERTLR